MKKEIAEQKGYGFTGVYNSSKQEVITRQESEEFKGYKTVIVPQQANRNSRGQNTGIVGYSLYAETGYFGDKHRKDLEQKLSKIDERKAAALKAYQEAISKIDEEAAEIRAKLGIKEEPTAVEEAAATVEEKATEESKTYTIKDIAEDLNQDARKIRLMLRKNFDKPEEGWNWNKEGFVLICSQLMDLINGRNKIAANQ